MSATEETAYHELLMEALRERDEARVQLAEAVARYKGYEDGITWMTECTNCARLMNEVYADSVKLEEAVARAEKAENGWRGSLARENELHTELESTLPQMKAALESLRQAEAENAALREIAAPYEYFGWNSDFWFSPRPWMTYEQEDLRMREPELHSAMHNLLAAALATPNPAAAELLRKAERIDAYVDCPDCLGRGYHGTGTDGPCDTCYGDRTLDARHVQALGSTEFWRDKYQEAFTEGKRAAAVVEAAREVKAAGYIPAVAVGFALDAALADYDAEAKP